MKMEDFRRKACLVAGFHVSPTLEGITCSSLVTRETVLIALTMAAIHHLEAKASEILNTYVRALNRKKKWTVLGPKFGTGAAMSAIIVRKSHGPKSTGASIKAHLTCCMQELGYESCKADPYLWWNLRPGHRTNLSIIHAFYVIWMKYVVSIIIQMMY